MSFPLSKRELEMDFLPFYGETELTIVQLPPGGHMDYIG